MVYPVFKVMIVSCAVRVSGKPSFYRLKAGPPVTPCPLLAHNILTEVTTTTATSPPCLNELDPKEASDKPGDAAEETEYFDGLPVSAETTVPKIHAEERSTVDCLEDESESCPPATRKDKVREPRNFVRHGGDEPNDAKYNRESRPDFCKDEAFRGPRFALGVWMDVEADDTSSDLRSINKVWSNGK